MAGKHAILFQLPALILEDILLSCLNVRIYMQVPTPALPTRSTHTPFHGLYCPFLTFDSLCA